MGSVRPVGLRTRSPKPAVSPPACMYTYTCVCVCVCVARGRRAHEARIGSGASAGARGGTATGARWPHMHAVWRPLSNPTQGVRREWEISDFCRGGPEKPPCVSRNRTALSGGTAALPVAQHSQARARMVRPAHRSRALLPRVRSVSARKILAQAGRLPGRPKKTRQPLHLQDANEHAHCHKQARIDNGIEQPQVGVQIARGVARPASKNELALLMELAYQTIDFNPDSKARARARKSGSRRLTFRAPRHSVSRLRTRLRIRDRKKTNGRRSTLFSLVSCTTQRRDLA